MKRFSKILLLFILLFFQNCKKNDSSDLYINEPYDKNIQALVVQDDIVWAGTLLNGIYKLEDGSWTNYTVSDGLPNNLITALTTDKNNALWVGTDKGLSKYENGNWTSFTTNEGLFSDDIRSLTCDANNNLWIGSRNNRLVKYNNSNFETFHVNPEVSGPKKMGHIHTVACDNHGNVWVGSCISGLSVFDGNKWIDYFNNLTVFVTSLICLKNDDVWIGHFTGAYKLSKGEWTHFTNEDGLGNNSVKCFTIDTEDNIWVGTENGLSKFNSSTWTTYTSDDGLPENYVNAVACDSSGQIWVGCSNGLAKLSKK